MWNILFTLSKAFFLSFFVSFLIWFFYFFLIKGIRRKKGTKRDKRAYKRNFPGKFKRILIDLPRQLVYDFLSSDPDFFREYGVHIVAGEQGSGKTMTVAYLLRRFKLEYPRLYIKTNFHYKYEDGEIRHWKDVIASETGCLTIVFKFKPVIKADSGTPDEKKFRGIFFFVHDKELRDSYDTYHKIEQISKEGFKPADEHIRSTSNIFVERKKGFFGK